ncbi:hypothetical protein [Paracoccus aminovorans]|uniref:hypothetical protein n=1 Tax=Paracoccus aminovorans TaxID=34004 RepID=UPI000782C494|nr:hypothetical protein [Paracoccus aminovorans]
MTFDADRCQGPAIAIRALTQDSNAAPCRKPAIPCASIFKEAEQTRVFEWKQDGALPVTGAGYPLPSSAIRPGHELLVLPDNMAKRRSPHIIELCKMLLFLL